MAVAAQLLVVYYAVANYHYVVKRLRIKCRSRRRPWTALIIPCKGIDARFASNLRSFFELDYGKYDLLLVVEEESDPAYEALTTLKDELRSQSRARDIQVLVAGPARSCSQKLHNLLYALDRVPADCEVLAFADSDICVRPDWLTHLVVPLYVAKRGATTGYRWFVPAANDAATLALSALNAAVAQFLGNNLFNQAWGGSMAIRVADFRRLGIAALWSQVLSDDLSLTRAVRQAGLQIAFVPQCLVASFESSTWRRLYEFGRRQLLITRVYAPFTWRLGLLSSLVSVLGLWGGAAAALYAGATHAEHVLLYALVPLVFLGGQITRAVLRQASMVQALNDHLARLLPAALADVFACWLWSPLLLLLILSSAVGRTICWRGIRYRLLGPTQIQVLDTRPTSAAAVVPESLS